MEMFAFVVLAFMLGAMSTYGLIGFAAHFMPKKPDRELMKLNLLRQIGNEHRRRQADALEQVVRVLEREREGK